MSPGRGAAAMTGEPLLDVRGLCADYGAGPGAVHAVRDADLMLHRGEVLGLAGESGSGKSTLAYAITRLLRAPGIITAAAASATTPDQVTRSTCWPPTSTSSGCCAGPRSRS